MEIIELSYRGYGIKVTSDPDGWTNHLRFPNWAPDEFIWLSKYDFASDAVQATMYWIEWQSTDSILHEILGKEIESDRLTHTEFNSLFRSAEEARKKRLPDRSVVES